VFIAYRLLPPPAAASVPSRRLPYVYRSAPSLSNLLSVFGLPAGIFAAQPAISTVRTQRGGPRRRRWYIAAHVVHPLASIARMKFDFLVIGAGIAGASIAYELSDSGRVCLIEAEAQPGFHATGRSAALFAPSYGGPEIRAANLASRAFFDRPPPGFCDHPLLHRRRALYIARSDQSGRLHQLVADIRGSGGTTAMITNRDAVASVPLLRAGYVAEAALDPDAMDIDVAALHQGYLRGARAAGAVVATNTRVVHVEHRNGLWKAAISEGSAVAPVLINAAGAWADGVAEICGAQPVGLRAYRRTAVLVDAPVGVDIREWPAVIDASEQFYFKPDAGKLLLSPADEMPDMARDVQPEEVDIALCVDRIEAALDMEVRRIRRSWAGLRTFAPDRVPVVGFDADVAGFFWCAGQGGYGIQTAPALARTAAALVKREPPPADIVAQGLKAEDLSPRRFVGYTAASGECPGALVKGVLPHSCCPT
jgi:D-arginine dehydrogenase